MRPRPGLRPASNNLRRHRARLPPRLRNLLRRPRQRCPTKLSPRRPVPPAVEPAPAPEEEAAGSNLEAVTVFAQKREQSAQSVPSSVTAISGSDVQLKLDNDPGSLSRVVPSLYSSQTGNRGSRPNYFLRGVGANTGITSPVAVYYDEVVLNILDFQSFPLFDLDRIEALRGPPRNALGQEHDRRRVALRHQETDVRTGWLREGHAR